jgi:hypothetical protein
MVKKKKESLLDTLIGCARAKYQTDEVQIEDEAALSFAEGGVWVQAWLFVPAAEVPA